MHNVGRKPEKRKRYDPDDDIALDTEMPELECCLCGAGVTQDDFCMRCGSYICHKCNKAAFLMFHHEPKDHLDEE